jgi:hypothetical protein
LTLAAWNEERRPLALGAKLSAPRRRRGLLILAI